MTLGIFVYLLQKTMAEIEVKATKNVMEACADTPSVRKCVLTSSLLACIWHQNQLVDRVFSTVITHRDWSDESICQSKRVVNKFLHLSKSCIR